MYERFTDRARKVLQLANQEAQRTNQEFIYPEHILIALLREGSGVASRVLQMFPLDVKTLRDFSDTIHLPISLTNLNKLTHSDFTKRILEDSINEAKNYSVNYVATEHLLLGSLKNYSIVNTLVCLGIIPEEVRQRCLNLINPKQEDSEELQIEQVFSSHNLTEPFITIGDKYSSLIISKEFLLKLNTDNLTTIREQINTILYDRQNNK